MINNIRKKKNHYLAQVYLKGFCGQNDMIWTYNKCNPNTPYCRKPENTAIINNFYAIHYTDTNAFENFLADQIESPAAKALKALQTTGQVPSDDDKHRLALFLAYMLVRTPAYRTFYEPQFNKEISTLLQLNAKDKEHFQRWADDYETIHKEPIANDVEQLRQEILDGKYKTEVHPNFSLYIMQKLGSNCADLLLSMKWIIIKSPEDLYFLSSDNPIIVTNPNCMGFYSPGLGLENTRIFVPISKRVGLLMVRLDEDKLDNKIISNSSEIVKNMNKTLVYAAAEFIFAHEQSNKIIRLIENIKAKNR